MELKLRGKSTTQSHGEPIYYIDLVIKYGISLKEAMSEATVKAKRVKEEGVNQTELDGALAKGFSNALFEYDEDEMRQVIEEFYPAAGAGSLGNS